jgi:hypothetical protein
MLDADFASRPLWVAAFSCMLTIAKFPLLFSLSGSPVCPFQTVTASWAERGKEDIFLPTVLLSVCYRE